MTFGAAMTNQTPVIIDVLVSWFPMLLLIGVWVYFMRRCGGGGKITTSEYYEQFLQEQKRSNEALEKILTRLENRLQQ
jgi:ATP-dependent Zn protease